MLEAQLMTKEEQPRQWVTLAERRERSLQKRKDAIRLALADLAEQSRELSGRFILFGSSATNRAKRDSDIDLLLDFDDSDIDQAYGLAERVCMKHGVPCDILNLRQINDTGFLDFALRHAVEIS